MKKNILLVIFYICISNIYAQNKDQHGITLGGGLGFVNKEYRPFSNGITNGDTKYKYNLFVGYKLRKAIENNNQLFWDLDVNIGTRTWKYSFDKGKNSEPPVYEASSEYYYLSTSGTIYYSIYKNLSLGIGVEPTYYFYNDGEKSNKKFDSPIIGKIAYNFGKFELGLSYKHGLFKTIDTDYLKVGKFRDIQLSLFIPF